VTETARPNRPDQIGQTETAQIETAQTESPVPGKIDTALALTGIMW